MDSLEDLFKQRFYALNPVTGRWVSVRIHAIYNYNPITVRVKRGSTVMAWRLTLSDLKRFVENDS